MNFSGRDDSQHDFQIAPLIDIVFLLLVFFVVTSSMAYLEREMSVDLPEAQSAETAESRYNELVVNVTRSGAIIVNRHTFTPGGLEARLKRLARLGGAVPGVIIRADKETAHKHVVQVMDVCARAEVKHIYFSTQGDQP